MLYSTFPLTISYTLQSIYELYELYELYWLAYLQWGASVPGAAVVWPLGTASGSLSLPLLELDASLSLTRVTRFSLPCFFSAFLFSFLSALATDLASFFTWGSSSRCHDAEVIA